MLVMVFVVRVASIEPACTKDEETEPEKAEGTYEDLDTDAELLPRCVLVLPDPKPDSLDTLPPFHR